MHEVKLNIDDYIQRAIRQAELDSRSKEILERRFGLTTPGFSTLQELGDEHKVTRERVRQLESQAVKKIKLEFVKIGEISRFMDFTRDYLNAVGGLKRHDFLVKEFYLMFKTEQEESVFENELEFLFEILEFPNFFEEDDVYHRFWYLEEKIYERMEAIHQNFIQRLKNIEHFEEVLREVIKPHRITEPVALNYLSVSKKIGIGPFGDLGLSDWEEINPRTVRAKIYLVLKRADKPLHFNEIADSTRCHPPTVHNELIKDKRFKLVSRGIYALKK